jgi:hypothetical protein
VKTAGNHSNMQKNIGRWPLILCFFMTGCSGISKGVTQALLERPEVDNRQCHVSGPGFEGVEQSVMRKSSETDPHSTKILMVHGISHHLPGYSYPFRAKLTQSLGLNAMLGDYKEIKLKHPDYKNEDGSPADLGLLRVYNHFDTKSKRDLLFYELTWSPITEPRKELIAFDESFEYKHDRAQVNAALKTFMNSTVPDLLIYLGSKKEEINIAVAQSMCWMFSGDWDVIQDGQHEYCDPTKDNVPDEVRNDDFFFVTHSLGSRITIDMIHFFSIKFAEEDHESEMVQDLNRAIQEKNFNVYMLANQLPLLELAHEPPQVVKMQDQFCRENSPRRNERVMNKMNIVAFSDPNDILSYPVPPRYAQEHIDSRICAEVTNVLLNVADQKNVFGLTNFADPIKAHQGYMDDDRVIGLITDGMSTENAPADIVTERCQWTEIQY